MPFSGLDTASVARCLSLIAEREEDIADAYFERVEVVQIGSGDRPAEPRARVESGFAVRFVRGAESWLAARDSISTEALLDGLRQVARAWPRVAFPTFHLEPPGVVDADRAPELAGFPGAVERGVRSRHMAFPVRMRLRRHRRWLRVVGPRLVAEPQAESFYSCTAEGPWGRCGLLSDRLDSAAADRLAGELVARFRAGDLAGPEPHRGVTVLGPGAAAVFLHEAVAHALETDTLMLSGRPEAAVGLQLGRGDLSVLDDPGSAPAGVRRTTDDEGMTVLRRWLLRAGVVEQPLASSAQARGSEILAPGAARRGSRHLPPAPRSTHLEILPGPVSGEEMYADAANGLYLPQASRGRLDPISGEFVLHVPYGRRIVDGRPADPVGPCRLRGRVADLLTAVRGIGSDPVAAGAGWCAKDGHRLPVWATTPPIRLEGVEVVA